MSEGVVSVREYQVSVRRLVEFTLRTGDLVSATSNFPSRLRAQEGSRAHRKLQKARPESYDSEVPISRRLDGSAFTLLISGRLDGLWRKPDGVLIEEIKTVSGGWDYQPDSLHWAQIKIYGWMFAEREELSELDLQLTYFSLETEQITVFREKYTRETLREFGEAVAAEYLTWIEDYDRWITSRNEAILELPFPYSTFRKGQRELSRAVYKTIVAEGNLFAEAPTGIGKTISVLFPAIKAFPAAKMDRIFFLTARNTTQELARSALSDIADSGLAVRAVTFAAKEKLCQIDGVACDPLTCPRAKGYFDRRKAAIREALGVGQVAREELETVATKHQVCAHELSLDISEWVDVVVCDYNYAFDPSAQIKRHFGEESGRHLLLIDEAHNLVDRAREMFSGELHSDDFVKGDVEIGSRTLVRQMEAVSRAMQGLVSPGAPIISAEPPQKFLRTLERFIEAVESYFAENRSVSASVPLLQTYFAVLGFLQISEFFGPSHKTIMEREGDRVRVRLLCLDPSRQLREKLETSVANILFSATLTPLEHFRTVLGGDEQDTILRLPSPFPPENLQVLVTPHISTAFRNRASSLAEVAAAIQTFVSARTGNYMVFFPSYSYMNEVLILVQQQVPYAKILVQTGNMADGQRGMFLDAFEEQTDKLVIGFAVMGGIFGEGIDLVGNRLIGVAVIGPGLPQLSLERNLIRDYFDADSGQGFDFAYLFPGLNRVLQAAGRLIRSEKDRGVVMLVDNRFAEPRIYSLLPQWWSINVCRDSDTLKQDLDAFWAARHP